jgi:hypothetical protein
MRKQDRIQQQKNQNQDPSRHQGESQSPPDASDRIKGRASDTEPSRPPREPGQPLPLPE